MLAEAFGIDGVVIVVVVLGSLALAVYCIVDVTRQPMLTSGQKTVWALGFAAGWFLFGLLGIILEVIYLAAVRPRLGRRPD